MPRSTRSASAEAARPAADARRAAVMGSPPAVRAAEPAIVGGPEFTYLIGRLHRAVRSHMTDVVREFGLSVAQYTTLSVLRTRGQLSNAQLANRAFISPQAMNEVVQSLEGQKLITRRPDPAHGRIVQLTLTARGTEILRNCDTAVRALETKMLAGLTDDARTKLRTALVRCAEALERP
jgi:DNA-binding MarR family transcriptional regulator